MHRSKHRHRGWLVGILVAWSVLPGLAVAADKGPFAEDDPITAKELLAAVLELNPGLQELQAAAQVAALQVPQAGALDDPNLSITTPPATLGDPRGLQQRIEISQSLPWPGKLTLREQAAEAEANAAGEDVETLRLRVAATAKALFADWYYVQRAIALLQEHQALLVDLRQTAETQYITGRVLQQDVLQADVERARLEAEIIDLKRRKRAVQAQINALLNRPPQAAVPPPAGLPERAVLPPLEKLEQLAIARHPVLQGLGAQLAATKAREALADKTYYPDFRVSGGYNSLWDDPDKRAFVGVSINLPFDIGGKREAEVQAARAATRRFRWALTDQTAELLAEVAQNRADVAAAAETIELYKDRLLPLAEENLSAAVSDYRAGGGSFLNIIDAERQQLRVADNLVRARAEYLREVAELERWVGGTLPEGVEPENVKPLVQDALSPAP